MEDQATETAGESARARRTETRLLMGNEAIGLAAIAAGVNVACGYPGTPSTEIVEAIARNNPAGAVHVEWSTNEKAALELAAGASYAGARVIVTCKQVGLNVAADPLMSLAYVGVRGGLVLVVADDPGPISSQTEQDTRQFAQLAHVPVLDPATPEEAWEMTQAAFELSEAHGCPVIVRPTTRVDHGCAAIQMPTDIASLPRHAVPGFKRDPRFVIFPPLSRAAHARMADDLDLLSEQNCTSRFNHLLCYPELPAIDPATPAATARATDPAAGGEAPATIEASATGWQPAELRADDTCELGIACGGDARGYVREALGMLAATARSRGESLPACRLLEVGTPFPFPHGLGRRFLSGLARVLVVEELEPVIESSLFQVEARMATGVPDPGAKAAAPEATAPAPRLPIISGRLDRATPIAGEYSCDLLLPVIADFLGAGDLLAGVASPVSPASAGPASGAPSSSADAPAYPALLPDPPEGLVPPRPPVLCAGCPHRASFIAVKRAVGARRAFYSGDIGCYTLGCGKPLSATDTCLCMGAGVTVAQGLETAARLSGDDEALHVGFVGDSTFFASALTGIANAVYNRHRMCLCVLDNSTTAMTGSQPHPGTGVTLMGTRSTPISIPDVCRALGAEVVEVVDPLDCDEAQAAAESALACPGVSVVVFRSPCVQLFRPLPSVEIDRDACTGCGACVRRTGCPALSMRPGADGARRGTAQVDPSLCYGCDLCLSFCRFGALSTPRAGTSPEQRDAMRREALRG